MANSSATRVGGSYKREGVADDADPGPRGLAGEDRRHQVGRGHVPVGVLVVLVDAHAVEPELLGVHELVEVAVVEGSADRGVVQLVRARDPGRAVVGRVEADVRHQVEREEAHAVPLIDDARAAHDNGAPRAM